MDEYLTPVYDIDDGLWKLYPTGLIPKLSNERIAKTLANKVNTIITEDVYNGDLCCRRCSKRYTIG